MIKTRVIDKKAVVPTYLNIALYNPKVINKLIRGAEMKKEEAAAKEAAEAAAAAPAVEEVAAEEPAVEAVAEEAAPEATDAE